MPGSQGVRGSSPLSSTKKDNRKRRVSESATRRFFCAAKDCQGPCTHYVTKFDKSGRVGDGHFFNQVVAPGGVTVGSSEKGP